MWKCGGNLQTTEHLLACPHIWEPRTNEDRTKATDQVPTSGPKFGHGGMTQEEDH